ncbi:hypothetical protein CKO25_17940 [Thiocapsa imhoffii]|uniref:Flagellar assembly protein T N-terminal domain-containing protein n=1 Tax=Thiocapsa imhoffii TaxID=382777 RepID=A0A9X0WM24_9GAMM|nr:flagellar assembly protein T N-terminal domain-containing protein [Thiocapsa imhoffii]MBK1646492.1 hypothetical protein [Thiocapsa imhoffii]
MKINASAIVLIVALSGVSPLHPLHAEPASGLSDITVITVEGEALIEGADIPAARQRALQEAFTAALTQALGAYLTADSFTRNFESIDRGVYSRTQGYIKTYNILNEDTNDGLLALQVEAQVSTEPLQDDLLALGILLDGTGNPVMQVQGTEEGLDLPVSPRMLQERLSQQGFQVQSVVTHPHDVMIQVNGKVQSTNEIGRMGMYGAIVVLDANASWQPGGRTIASAAESANGAGLSVQAALQDAYAKAADKLFPTLLERITSAWQAELNAGRLVSIAIDAADLSEVTAFKRRLGRIFGVDQVDMKSFTPGRGDLVVRFRGSAPQLAELIQMTDFRNPALRVISVDNSAIALSIGLR